MATRIANDRQSNPTRTRSECLINVGRRSLVRTVSRIVLSVSLSAASNNDVHELKVHLPNYLTGVHVFFHEIDQSTVQRLQRFVYTYVRAGAQKNAVGIVFFACIGLVSMATSTLPPMLEQQRMF